MDVDVAKNQSWDYLIVGTGMGGGTLGYALAKAGHKVLFLEQGRLPYSKNSLRGNFPEMMVTNPNDRIEALKWGGRLSEDIYFTSGTKSHKVEPIIGSGVGGSSALYGMVLERFQPADFIDWPLKYDDFARYYDFAEILFQVKNSQPNVQSELNSLWRDLESKKLKPYGLPIANSGEESCQVCQSFLCINSCKKNSANICVLPAVEECGAALLTDCRANSINIKGNLASGVNFVHKGDPHTLSATNIILACGALKTPIVLLNSKNSTLESGIGVHSDMVGRNLMRHYIDLYTLKLSSPILGPQKKSMGLNDFYNIDGKKFGAVQSFGSLPPTELILAQFYRDIANRWGPVHAKILTLLKPFISLFINWKISGRLILASILEDSPHPENRVWTENGRTHFAYKISRQDISKIKFVRQTLKKTFKSYSVQLLPFAKKNEMLAHICGTCKMGNDPNSSVVDSENRVHGTQNLYIIDSSFFPTSGGTNPALTIAANALRVADILSKGKVSQIINSKENSIN